MSDRNPALFTDEFESKAANYDFGKFFSHKFTHRNPFLTRYLVKKKLHILMLLPCHLFKKILQVVIDSFRIGNFGENLSVQKDQPGPDDIL